MPARRSSAERCCFARPKRGNYHLFDVGAQVDLGFTVVMRLPMVFSVGVGHGFGDKDIDGRTEVDGVAENPLGHRP